MLLGSDPRFLQAYPYKTDPPHSNGAANHVRECFLIYELFEEERRRVIAPPLRGRARPRGRGILRVSKVRPVLDKGRLDVDTQPAVFDGLHGSSA